MKIEHIDPAKLVPADYNPRRIDDHQLEALKRSISRWGFVQPVIVNDRTGLIVGGHQRVTAAMELALETVPVVRVTLDETAEKALNIALNKVSGEWDAVALHGLLEELKEDGWDLVDLGFDSTELEGNLGDWEEEMDLPAYDPAEERRKVVIEVSPDKGEELLAFVNTALEGSDFPFRANLQ